MVELLCEVRFLRSELMLSMKRERISVPKNGPVSNTIMRLKENTLY